MVDHRKLSYAPWTTEQVESLRGYQNAGHVHPFTGTNSEPLIPTAEGWVEVEGGPVVQNWAHEWMVDGTWDFWDSLALKDHTKR